jgi:hypothetical protein
MSNSKLQSNPKYFQFSQKTVFHSICPLQNSNPNNPQQITIFPPLQISQII